MPYTPYQNPGMSKAQRIALELEQQRVNQGSLGQRIARMLARGVTNQLQTAGMRDMQRTMPTPTEGAQVAQALQQARATEAQVPGFEARSRVAGMEADDASASRLWAETYSPEEGLALESGTASSDLVSRLPFMATARGASLIMGTGGPRARLAAQAAADAAREERALKLTVADKRAAPLHAEVARKKREGAIGEAEEAVVNAKEFLRGAKAAHDALIAKPGTDRKAEARRYEGETASIIMRLGAVTREARGYGWEMPSTLLDPGQEALSAEKTSGKAAERAYKERGGALGPLNNMLRERVQEQDLGTQARNDVDRQFRDKYKPILGEFKRKEIGSDAMVPLDPRSPTERSLLLGAARRYGAAIRNGLTSSDNAARAAALDAIAEAESMPNVTVQEIKRAIVGESEDANFHSAVETLFSDDKARASERASAISRLTGEVE